MFKELNSVFDSHEDLVTASLKLLLCFRVGCAVGLQFQLELFSRKLVENRTVRNSVPFFDGADCLLCCCFEFASYLTPHVKARDV